MALVNCKECGKKISDKASMCPNCGCPTKEENKKQKRENRINGLSIWLVLCSIICFIISVVDMVNLLDLDIHILKIGVYDFHIMSFFAFILGVSYILLLKNKSKRSFHILLGVNTIILLYNFLNIKLTLTFKMGLSVIYIFCVFANTIITTLVIRKHLNNNRLTLKNNKLILAFFIIGLIGLLAINFSYGNSYPQTNKRNENVAQVEIVTDYINIRRYEAVDSEIIGKVYKGEIYTILSENKESEHKWLEIETSNGIRGYISGIDSYIKRLNTTTNNEEPSQEEPPPTNNETPSNNEKPSNNQNTQKPSNNEKPNNSQKPNNNTNNNQKPNNNNNSNTNTNKPNNDNNSNNKPNIDNNNPIPPNENDNKEQEELKKQYLIEVDAENLRYENEVKSIKEEYDLHELNAKDKMADALYFVSFFGGLYYGTERDYRNEYQKLMNNGKYDEADILAGKWHHTQEYRKWEEYLRGLSQEEQYYLERKQKEHNNILNELKVKYNQ